MTDLYQHFRKEEQSFIDQVLSWRESVERTYQAKLSDFLTPREVTIYQSLIGKDETLTLSFFGGGEDTERKRALLAPYYEDMDEERFEIVLMEASYPEKFVSLTHRDIMGAFLSAGIKRKKLGDIVVRDGRVQILMGAEIAAYVQANLTSIKKAKMTFEEKPLARLMEKEERWTGKDLTVSSLRLDVVIKETYQISRQNAADFIQKGAVKVNFQVVDNPAFLLEEGDLLSVRGKGRGHLQAVHGKSRKDKWKVTVRKLT